MTRDLTPGNTSLSQSVVIHRVELSDRRTVSRSSQSYQKSQDPEQKGPGC